MPTSEPKRRWFRPSPDRFVAGLLLMVCLLWLSRLQYLGLIGSKITAAGVKTLQQELPNCRINHTTD